jgi:hypothetical protein
VVVRGSLSTASELIFVLMQIFSNADMFDSSWDAAIKDYWQTSDAFFNWACRDLTLERLGGKKK